MKFSFIDKTKPGKQAALLLLFVFLTTGALFIQFRLRKPSAPPVASPEFMGTGEVKSRFLPFGSEFSSSLFDNPRFSELKTFPPLQVNPSDLGLANPFSSQ